ncbi:nucleoside deaminase [Petroclostridium sp. X23]|jgi:guanine deaminase|uniref:nucleoside deaminase n=1 Tax=Petroclostridium sp. X23 TaxID=3045146 RepID=UPI0024AE3FF6|nr:nucleoside deaminase [Petroclostridium sp. X23]WHH57817.1 nucleoside deaminase [Petroclostridium sp. X23]
MNEYMKAAYDEAMKNITGSEGGPFGAVIVKDGEIVASAHNQVLATNDPTMHAEIAAIRMATRRLGRFHLEDCEIYATCEPCPMCMAAIIWAKIPKVYFGANRKDAEDIGFDDNYIYEFIAGSAREIKTYCYILEHDSCVKLFDQWIKKENKEMY